jgi:hypothetical protein
MSTDATMEGSGEMRERETIMRSGHATTTPRKYTPGMRVRGTRGTVAVFNVGTLPTTELLDCEQCHIQPLLSGDSVRARVTINGMSISRRVCTDRCVIAFVSEALKG